MDYLAPIKSLAPVRGGDMLAGLIPAEATPKAECDILVNDLREALRIAKAAANLPIRYLNMTNKMVNKISSDALAMTDAALAEIQDILNLPLAYLNNPALSLAPSEAALNAMLTCAYALNNKDLIHSLTDATNMMRSGRKLFRNLSTAFQRYVGRSIAKSARALVNDQLRNPALSKINSISKGYKDLLKKTGVTKSLQTMDRLINCAADMCSTIVPLVSQINGLYSQLGLDSNGDPLNIFTNSTKISDSKKYIANSSITKLNSIENSIKQFELF